MADHDEVQGYQHLQASGGTEDHTNLAENISRALNGGRDAGQRALYNQTRAGLWNSETDHEESGAYGGLGSGLKARRQSDMSDAQAIEDKFRK